MSRTKIGDILEGTVVKVYPRYAILLFDGNETGLLHISEVSNHYIHSFPDLVKVGNIYKVKVIALDEESGSMKVSLKQLTHAERRGSITKRKIEEGNISFSGLKEKLPEWIAEENKKE